MPDTTKVRIIGITSPYRPDIECDTNVNRWDEIIKGGNFQWNEICDHNELTLKFCPEFILVPQWVRTNKGWVVEVLAGYRTKKTNDATPNADPNSIHMKGYAIDVKCWYDYVGGRQVNPIHVAYAFQEAFKALGLKGGIGTYYKGYDGSKTNGYNHIDLRTYTHYYVCMKAGNIKEIKSLDELFIW